MLILLRYPPRHCLSREDFGAEGVMMAAKVATSPLKSGRPQLRRSKSVSNTSLISLCDSDEENSLPPPNACFSGGNNCVSSHSTEASPTRFAVKMTKRYGCRQVCSEAEGTSWKQEIRIGPEFQAEIPSLSNGFGSSAPQEVADNEQQENEPKLMWKCDVLNEQKVVKFLIEYYQILYPRSPKLSSSSRLLYRDDEYALYLLHKSGYKKRVAVSYLKQQLATPKRGHTEDSDLVAVRQACCPTGKSWPVKDVEAFEEGIKEFGKDFYKIQRKFLIHRTVGQLVTFYYAWKKSERHDSLVQTVHYEKRNFRLHPKAT
ncbi:unnamed protein product [Soboliphyme baturini]|uniref:SANT domain-containing protein n=1 Tax=Soboliphyme baturini TaxID=241478 RepID=A0A183J066_9BILA|nr:unnamed protein product [Soboliphyme baturini]